MIMEDAGMSTDLNDHPFAIFMAGESYVSPSEQEWLAWERRVEKALGHSIDGDEATDGYSQDGAYAAWEAGVSVKEYVAEVRVAKAEAAS